MLVLGPMVTDGIRLELSPSNSLSQEKLLTSTVSSLAIAYPSLNQSKSINYDIHFLVFRFKNNAELAFYSCTSLK